MARQINPFQTLYLTEALEEPEQYYQLFSPTIITGEAESLFRVGNVVLLGSYGTGKTMLLRLFAPTVQAAYLRKGLVLPFPRDSHRLLGVSLNLVHAGFGSLGRRKPTPESSPNDAHVLWPLMMGDLLNYSLVDELLSVLQFLSTEDAAALARSLKATVTTDALDSFAVRVAKSDGWFGALTTINSYRELRAAIRSRISIYRAFMNWNIDRLPQEIMETKTEIGHPISICRKELTDSDVIPAETPLMVAIDQYESLLHTDWDILGKEFCRVANSLLARRDPTVSYKIGVRPYGWTAENRPLGTDAQLELGRDYHVVNLDEVLRRKESVKAWIFPLFADDVASRRLAQFQRDSVKHVADDDRDREKYKEWLKQQLEEISPEKEIERYASGPASLNALRPVDTTWPPEWRSFVQELFRANKFEAKLAEVWINQTLASEDGLPSVESVRQAPPWQKEWWQKERRAALMTQIASVCRQRRLYGGWDDVIMLSGSNILIFLSLCREIWDIKARSIAKEESDTLPTESTFSIEIQSQAIRLVAESWLKKQTEWPRGAKRQEFVVRLGIAIRKQILADKGLSYPGHNGFSLPLEEYQAADASLVRDFLENATDFGALVSSPHTTKEKDKRPRRKWYVFPILCPNFEIPAVRTKEPYYATIEEVQRWLSDDRPAISLSVKRRKRTADVQVQSGQVNMFDPKKRD